MTLLFTQEELVQYLYNETSAQKAADIEAALSSDWMLHEKFEVLQHSVQALNTPLESPRTEVLFNVMNYARESVEVE
jgi:hypothetical protein